MRFSRLLSRWQGVVLSLLGIVATLWLAASGQLGLYIHPRYYGFTVIMAVLAAVLCLAAFAFVPGSTDEDDEHEGHATPAPRGRRWAMLGGAAIIVGSAIALLALPPAALSSATVEQRELNSGSAAVDAPDLVGADTAAFTVRDWASLLAQNPSPDDVAGTPVDVVGFVTADPAGSADVFYIARFVVTCCAVDAQPVGVPVHFPGWQEQFQTDDWVEASGAFIRNPDATGATPLTLLPETIEPVEQPAEPYVY
ncbi:TIGR03943 family protein [Agromyces atrinae]|uniref:TIGR03943 family putative permease subunit n=1 Tax=Agromyces atrinae TaxID=592376 RepID=UPI001F5835BE|nr:TIGR03943 family protein [Agromyces atrinae]MCI2957593.1 TIGR03943 family protein [Agromyces atrinae]